MPFIVRVDDVECVDCVFKRREAKHPFPVRKERAGTCILNHDRFSAGQIADGSVANPGVLKLHTRALGTTELSARTLDVRLIHLGCSGYLTRVTVAPAAY